MAILLNVKPRIKVKKLKKIFRVLKLIFILIIGGAVYSLGVAVSENVQVDQAIRAFKARSNGEYVEEIVMFGTTQQTRRYYSVSRETSYELADTRSVFQSTDRMHLGQKGDIFVSQDSPFPRIPVIHQFISYFFGGHAAIHTGEGNFVEAVGFPDDDESLWDIMTHPGNEPHDFSTVIGESQTNYWLNPAYRDENDPAYPYFGPNYRKDFVGLRVKDIELDQIDGAVDFAQDKVGKSLYNFWFFLDMTYKYYCTDLVSRAYQDVMIPRKDQKEYSRALNDDGFITSVNDMILSKDTYIVFYVEFKNDIAHIYYLEDV
ncbi:MAG: YiiX/YebB-like N1pC/P60 family cysteine hydrolase [Acholeplasmataceae bacterium]|jgi:hypothetical protein|nr:YiiX/YebB-like N1pC/P60 family cysteine hydrolase [Acholeplasmataceae bacterium]